LAIAWIAVGIVLIAVELHHLAFYALFVAVGCFAAAVVAVAVPDAIALQVAVAVVVENAPGGGSAFAAPIARRILDRYLLTDDQWGEQEAKRKPAAPVATPTNTE